MGNACDWDADGDGFSNDKENRAGSDWLNQGKTPEVCDDARVDEDKDGSINEGYDYNPVNGVPDCTDPAANTDGDAWTNPNDSDDDNDDFSDGRENYMATDSMDACPDGSNDDAWPLDINNDTKVRIGDIMEYFAYGSFMSHFGDPPYNKRLDMNADGLLNIFDIMSFFAFEDFGTSCTN
jgi:hypothetical protein